MTQTLKPDRPIWPPVPEPLAPPDTRTAEIEPAEDDAALPDRPPREAGGIPPGTVEASRPFPGWKL